jgi:hypothetical protein
MKKPVISNKKNEADVATIGAFTIQSGRIS